jgi:signal transduction histidine kinase
MFGTESPGAGGPEARETMAQEHTILVVDDEPDVVKSVRDLLRLDYRVLGATRADEALDIVRGGQPVHVVMTDQRMPGMTGVELLAKVREFSPDSVRLLFTGYADISAVVAAINEGNVYRYIHKPWEPEELQQVVRDACERWDLVESRRRLVDELRENNERLEEANRLKESFIQVASHELRTPLTILLGLARLAQREKSVSPEVGEWLGRIDTAAKRLSSIVEQIVKILQQGKFDGGIKRVPTDVAALCRQAADDVRPFVELRRQRLTLEIDDALGQVSLDGPKMRDVLNHLLLNAIKFTPDEGQVSLRARRTPGGAGDTIELQVSDSGIGIPSADVPRLFEAFFTERDVSHHSSGHFEYNKRGIGLGLSIVKAFVEQHGGSVRVDTEVGRGSTFTVRLPAGRADGAAADEGVAAAAEEVR